MIWTRHRREPDLTPQIRAWFTGAGFEELAFGSPESAPRTGVGAAVLRDAGGAVLPEGPLFRFGFRVKAAPVAEPVANCYTECPE